MKLTRRQGEVLEWVFRGKENGEIGAILGISGATVKNHIGGILAKFNAPNRMSLIWDALRLGVLKSPAKEEKINTPPVIKILPLTTEKETPIIQAGKISIYPSGMIEVEGKETVLSLKGVKLLQIFLEHVGRIHTIDFLMDAVWGEDVTKNTVVVNIWRLRNILPPDLNIETVHGVGYRLTRK